VSAVRVLAGGPDWSDGSETEVAATIRAVGDRSSGSDELAAHIHDWPTRYHFSRLRANLLSPLRIGRGVRVLDLGGGTGPLARRLGELGADVLLVDASRDRAEAAAVRCEELSNVSVAVGTVFDLDETTEQFDVVLAVGLLEYAGNGPGGPAGMLRKVVSLLASHGVLALAIENAIGLKYLLGYAEDHLGHPWVGLEGYRGVDDVRTYSRRELATMLAEAGLTEQAWFSPFPDYKLPTVILSEAAYELGTDLVDAVVANPCTPDASPPSRPSDPRATHRTLLQAGLGPDTANSFLVTAAKTPRALDERVDQETVAWLSGAERRRRFMRARRLVAAGSGLEIVDDTADPEVVEDGWLTQRRQAVTPFVEGELLDRLLIDAIAADDTARVHELLTLWTTTLKERGEIEADGEPGSPFGARAGEVGLPGDYLDLRPANFVHRDGWLRRIDLEWEASGRVDFDLVCLRGLFYLALDAFARGILATTVSGDDLASVLASLAKAAGVPDTGQALGQFPAAEADLQEVVAGIAAETIRPEVERLLASTPQDIAGAAIRPSGVGVSSGQLGAKSGVLLE
jgi:2-polyprenyl-3-methyl-5-hydroxy-6-metoxy-1,4-benzoquinol methylase